MNKNRNGNWIKKERDITHRYNTEDCCNNAGSNERRRGYRDTGGLLMLIFWNINSGLVLFGDESLDGMSVKWRIWCWVCVLSDVTWALQNNKRKEGNQKDEK